MCNLEMKVIVGKLSALTIQRTIMEALERGQLVDPQMEKFKHEILQKKRSYFFISKDGLLGYEDGQICVTNDEEIKKQILYCNTSFTPSSSKSVNEMLFVL